MKGITKYPVDMQRGLVTNSWYEEYPTGRVIIRYGRSPQAFYVILGGSGECKHGGVPLDHSSNGPPIGKYENVQNPLFFKSPAQVNPETWSFETYEVFSILLFIWPSGLIISYSENIMDEEQVKG